MCVEGSALGAGLDALAADICVALRRRNERFSSVEELRCFLDEDGVQYTPEDLAMAMDVLERIGRDHGRIIGGMICRCRARHRSQGVQ